MLITIIRDDSDAVATAEVGSEMTVADVKALVANDLALSPGQIVLMYQGQELTDSQSIGAAGVENDSMLTASRRRAQGQASSSSSGTAGSLQRQVRQGQQAQQASSQSPGISDNPQAVEELRQQALSQPAVLQQMRAAFPGLAETVNDRQRFADTFSRAMQERQAQQELMQREFEFMDANPTAENQEKILEQIRLQQVEENRLAAIENLPMAFGQVTMLYIPAKVGTVEIKAFVDSGAQTTIMSPDCAERCGITHLIDKRYSGIARGVGSAKIIGRVHIANLIIGGQYFPCSFTVIEDQSLDFLLGLDMLKRHSASIDLAKNVLRIPVSEDGKPDVEVPFLPESEIPKRDLEPQESKAPQPGPTGSAPSPANMGASASASASASTAAARSASQAPQAQASATGHSQIQQLVDMFGCTQQEAVNALRTAGGNVEVAASILSGFM